MTRQAKGILAAAAIVAATCAAYVPAMRAGFTWDDDDYVTANKELTDAAGLGRIWLRPGATTQYYPLVYTTYWLEYRLWGLDPVGYHVVNVLLHAGAAVLLWRVLLSLGVGGAWLAAAIFALHPVCVESVAWVTERKNVLSAVLYFAAGLSYLKFCLPGRPPGQARARWGLYALSLVLFVAALLSKTVTATLPAALLLVIWWKRGRPTRRDLVTLGPMLLLGAGMGVATALIERASVGARGGAWDLSVVERVLLAGRALWFYAGKLALPRRLTFIYPRWQIDDGVWWQYFYPAAVVAVVAALWSGRRRLGRGPLVGVLFFAGTVFPALGFANVYFFRFSFVADHFQYLATPGLIALFAAAAAWIAGGGKALRKAGVIAAGLLLATLAALTWKQASVYKDQITHWRDTLAKNPDAWVAMNNLGVLLKNEGHLSEALDLFERCVVLNPDLPSGRLNRAEAYSSLGRLRAAVDEFTEAIKRKPRFPEAFLKRGQTWAKMGAFGRAIRDYDAAIKLNGDCAAAYGSRGVARAKLGRLDRAISDFTEAIRLDPRSAETFKNRGLALARQGAFGRAIGDYDKAVELKPDYAEAYNDRGVARARLGRFGPALRDFSKAVALRPGYIDARRNRALAFWKTGELAAAVEDAREAVELAAAAGRADLADDIRRQLALYQAGRPAGDKAATAPGATSGIPQ